MADLNTIIGATTVSVSAARQLASLGPASGVSGIIDNITGTVDTLTNSIGKIFSTTGAGIVDTDLTLPLRNPLHKYASYNCIFSLSCLDADSHNYPVTSYMSGKIPPLILKSGNTDPYNRIDIGDGSYEFYLDDLVLTGQYGFEQGTGNVNSTNIEFKITEPYSMGMFMIACQTAAYNQGWKNYMEAPYLLTIEFRGNTENGRIEQIPYTTKFIPFNLNNVEMSVSAAGSIYNVIGVISNSAGLNDSYRKIKSDATISGTTVQEILQTGEHSLQNVVNARYREMVNDKTASVPDEIVIMFPQDTSTDKSGNGISGQSEKETKTSATVDPKSLKVNDPKLFKQLGVSRSAGNHTLVQKSDDCNALGKAKLNYDTTRGGTTTFRKDNDVYDEKTQTTIRDNNTTSSGTTDFKFAQGSDIINAINQVLFKSEIPDVALKPDQMSKEGMRPWWKIDVQVYHIATDQNLKITGSTPKIVVYRVVPYQVHSSRLLAPNAPAPGIEELKKQAAKVYNYIYTGKNVDVLKFDIQINATFYQEMAADNFKRTGDKQISAQTASGSNNTQNTTLQTPTSPDEPGIGKLNTFVKYIGLLTSSDGKGGTRGDTESTRAARIFHDSMLNGMDMMNITMEIVGDPYYIANSGAGNYTASSTNLINVSRDGDINYQNGEVDIVINFRTPTDINQPMGMYDISSKSLLVGQFSGLYKITTIVSTFRNGQFTQTLTCNRRPGQDSSMTANSSSFLTSNQIIDSNLGKQISDVLSPVLDTINTTLNDIGNESSKISKSITNQFISSGGK